jgi:major membrane immunogen (membrane-anchored lipoprotein)
MKKYILITIIIASIMLISCSNATISDNLAEEKIFIAKQLDAGDRRDWSSGSNISVFNDKTQQHYIFTEAWIL